MFDRLSNEEISKAIDELIEKVGGSMDMPHQGLVSLLRTSETRACVQEIALRLGLPVRIELSSVANNPSLADKDRFRSSDLVRGSRSGEGTESITAQVLVPENLPRFGTIALNDYPIQVRISADCHQYPESFVAILAHELSHVLLAVLRHPMKANELYADLVPMILGFREVVRIGRKVSERTRNGNTTTVHTHRYGYLNDSQFDFAYNYVGQFVDQYALMRGQVLRVAYETKKGIESAFQGLLSYREGLTYLDSSPPRQMDAEDARKVVRLHDRDFCGEWEEELRRAAEEVKHIEANVERLNHFAGPPKVQLDEYARSLDRKAQRVGQIVKDISEDINLFSRYFSASYRIRRVWKGILGNREKGMTASKAG
jgi:hypothetical protein